jgi:hypothetical protein
MDFGMSTRCPPDSSPILLFLYSVNSTISIAESIFSLYFDIETQFLFPIIPSDTTSCIAGKFCSIEECFCFFERHYQIE